PRLRGHARPRGPFVPDADLPDDPLVHHREPRGAQERFPLRRAVGAHVRGIATPLDLGDERVGVGVVWPRMSWRRNEPPGRRTRWIWRIAAATSAKWCGAIRQVTTSNAPSRKGSAATSPAANATLVAPRPRMKSRPARSIGSVRS